MVEEIYERAHDNAVMPGRMSFHIRVFKVEGPRIDDEPKMYIFLE